MVVLAFLACLPLIAAMPMQLTVSQRATECLYDKLNEGEHVTMSVFILSGAELRATATLEGPVAPPEVNTGSALQESLERFRSGERYGTYSIVEEVVDFEHLQPAVDDDDDDDAEMKLPDPGDDDTEENASEREKRILEVKLARQRFVAARKKKALQRQEARKNVRNEGDPFQRTLQATSPGWYRACVRGTWYQITAELEMRKESDLGGVDDMTGHVVTYERQTTMEEERELERDTPSQENVKDEDFEAAKSKLRKLRRLLSEIQAKQTAERHRLVVHAATNEHSHSRMVLGSLLETVLFMLVTGYQVFTIRKWFRGAPALGR